MPVGIERINLYAGRLSLDIAELAAARRKDLSYIRNELMCESRSVYPAYEDAVTLAVNATRGLLTPEIAEDIELLIVGTESAVDFGKPVASWVHRFCSLPANCRTLEVKHACYGGTGALKMAASWVASGARPGKKALVVTSDLSRSHVGDQAEFICGGCSVAMVVSADPKILEIDPEKAGYWTSEIADTFRPTSRSEIGNNQVSLYSYLDALEGAYDHYLRLNGPVDYNSCFRKHIYHAPFPGMAFQAHRTMLSRSGTADKAAARASFREKVEEGLVFARRIGSAYGSSNFVCLLGLLHAGNLKPGDRISLFSYGSGCQGEFYSGIIGPSATDSVRDLGIERQLSERRPVSLKEYEEVETARERIIDCPDIMAYDRTAGRTYDEHYGGQGLLVLKEVKQHYRTYERT